MHDLVIDTLSWAEAFADLPKNLPDLLSVWDSLDSDDRVQHDDNLRWLIERLETSLQRANPADRRRALERLRPTLQWLLEQDHPLLGDCKVFAHRWTPT